MHVLAFVRWWYGVGWMSQLSAVQLHLRKVSDYFSLSLLVRNLFQPFRQISAGSVRGGFDIQFRAWLDRLISRFVGAIVRFFMIVTGCVWWLLGVLAGGVWLLFWPLLPLLPVLGLVLSKGLSL